MAGLPGGLRTGCDGAQRVAITGRQGHGGKVRMNDLATPGQLLDPSRLVDVPRLVTAYFTGRPDPAVPGQRVAFGTSGHRGSSFAGTFNEAHILAISQAVCHYRRRAGIDGPLFIGIDTHASSRPAWA